MAIKDWSTTAADNDDADGDIALVGNTTSIRNADNSQRAIMQKVKIWVDDNNGSRSTAGSSNTYTYASAGSASTPTDAFAAYATGDTLTIQANHTNTGAATLNVDSVGAKAIRKYIAGAEAALDANDIISAAPFTVIYDADANSAAGAWILQNPHIQLGSVFAASGSLSGASQNLTIPSWANVAIITLRGASMNAANGQIVLRLGDAGGIEDASGYDGSYFIAGSTITTSGTTGFFLHAAFGASTASNIFITLSRHSSDRTLWNADWRVVVPGGSGVTVGQGTKTLSAAITQAQLDVATATAFDAGTYSMILL